MTNLMTAAGLMLIGPIIWDQMARPRRFDVADIA
jgi:hypothetical protein